MTRLRNELQGSEIHVDLVRATHCVLHTLADAIVLGYHTVLVEDCAATPICPEATLQNICQIFGSTGTSAALLEGLPA